MPTHTWKLVLPWCARKLPNTVGQNTETCWICVHHHQHHSGKNRHRQPIWWWTAYKAIKTWILKRPTPGRGDVKWNRLRWWRPVAGAHPWGIDRRWTFPKASACVHNTWPRTALCIQSTTCLNGCKWHWFV
jgi:hypothetical protein